MDVACRPLGSGAHNAHLRASSWRIYMQDALFVQKSAGVVIRTKMGIRTRTHCAFLRRRLDCAHLQKTGSLFFVWPQRPICISGSGNTCIRRLMNVILSFMTALRMRMATYIWVCRAAPACSLHSRTRTQQNHQRYNLTLPGFARSTRALYARLGLPRSSYRDQGGG